MRVTSAEYECKGKELEIEATSDLGQLADLDVEGFGAMKWKERKQLWTLEIKRLKKRNVPPTVTVTGVEGTVTATVVKEGCGKKKRKDKHGKK